MKVGTIVSLKNESGFYRVTSCRGGKVNLGSIFGKTIYHKGIPVENVYENAAAWHERWTQSETYKCM